MATPAGKRASDWEIQQMLDGTSRTFAITVPLLSQPLRSRVGLAYLLFRVADSIEDAIGVAPHTRIALLHELSEAVHDGRQLSPTWRQQAASVWPRDCAVATLIERTDDLFSTLDSYPREVSLAVRQSLRETIEGMIWFLDASAETEFIIRIPTIADLRRYCFFVAGVVGEMLTDLFVLEHPVSGDLHVRLRKLGRDFGEALQLTNILKDKADDARHQRQFIPPHVDRSEVFQLAYEAVDSAHQYLDILHNHQFPQDILRFCRCPLAFAEETLAVVKTSGPGSKIDRTTIAKILSEL